MLWAQLDETGIHDKGTGRYKHLVVGGAIAEFSDWQTLEASWRIALKDEGLAAFHMSHFEASQYEFDGWSPARHRNLLNRLLHIIWESNIRACFAAGTIAPKEQKGRTWFPTIYKRCVRRMLTDLLWQADYVGSEERDIRAVFARHKEIDYPALAHYYQLISPVLPRRILMAEDIPERSPSLQVADLIVYEAARWLYDRDQPLVPRRHPLRWLHSKGMSVVLKIAPDSYPQS
jgi:hypothetical protein